MTQIDRLSNQSNLPQMPQAHSALGEDRKLPDWPWEQ